MALIFSPVTNPLQHLTFKPLFSTFSHTRKRSVGSLLWGPEFGSPSFIPPSAPLLKTPGVGGGGVGHGSSQPPRGPARHLKPVPGLPGRQRTSPGRATTTAPSAPADTEGDTGSVQTRNATTGGSRQGPGRAGPRSSHPRRHAGQRHAARSPPTAARQAGPASSGAVAGSPASAAAGDWPEAVPVRLLAWEPDALWRGSGPPGRAAAWPTRSPPSAARALTGVSGALVSAEGRPQSFPRGPLRCRCCHPPPRLSRSVSRNSRREPSPAVTRAAGHPQHRPAERQGDGKRTLLAPTGNAPAPGPLLPPAGEQA